jgi:hypothetical protein
VELLGIMKLVGALQQSTWKDVKGLWNVGYSQLQAKQKLEWDIPYPFCCFLCELKFKSESK